MKENPLSTATRRERAAFSLRALYDSYGYAPYTMSKFEEYDLYVRNKNFLVSDSVITFTDRTGRLLALKPDVTLSIVKNSRDAEGRRCVYYDENVYRVLPGESAFREIRQVGVECIGQVDSYALCEVLTLAKQSLQTLSEDYVLELSHMEIVSSVLDALCVGDAVRGELLHCLGEKNTHDMRRICCEAGVDEAATARLCALVTTCGTTAQVLPALRAWVSEEIVPASAVAQLETVARALGEDHVRMDFSLINDMNYYNGIVFRGYLGGLSESVLSGGQYDRLMRKMGRAAGAVGFAVYLNVLDRLPDEAPVPDAVDVAIFYDDATDPAAVLSTAAALRAQGKTVSVGRERRAAAAQVMDLRGKGEA